MVDVHTTLVAMQAVTKVLLVATIGGIAGKYFEVPQFSKRGIGVIAIKVFMPAMLCSRMAVDLTWDNLSKGLGWACVLSTIPMAIGYILSEFVFKHFIKEKELHSLFMLASTFQNCISFGMGSTKSLAGPSWVDASAYAQFASVVFLWDMPHSLVIWSFGSWFVRRAKEDEVMAQYHQDVEDFKRKREEGVARRWLEIVGFENLPPSSTPRFSLSEPVTPASSAYFSFPSNNKPSPMTEADLKPSLRIESPRNLQEEELNQTGSSINKKTNIPTSQSSNAGLITLMPQQKSEQNKSSMKKHHHRSDVPKLIEQEFIPPEQPPRKEGFESFKDFIAESLRNIAVQAILVGMILGLVPPLQYLVSKTNLGTVFVGALQTIGPANVPLTLLNLGISLSAVPKPKRRMIQEKRTKVNQQTGEVTVEIVEVKAPSKGKVKDYFYGLEVTPRFILFVVLIRLIIVPAVLFVLFVFLRSAGNIPILGPLPTSRPFQLTVLIQSCAPPATFTNNLCAMYQYKVVAYSHALFVVYVFAIFTTSFWLSLYLWYLGSD